MKNDSIYYFGKSRCDGSASERNLLGGKGANLAEMASLGLPVPPGFTISTEVCTAYLAGSLPANLDLNIRSYLSLLEAETGEVFGGLEKPLLLSVRSGARVSMPGMMDTVLNLGLNDEVVGGLASRFGARMAFDCYRRFIAMFANVVESVPMDYFENCLVEKKQSRGILCDTDLSADDLKELCDSYKNLYRQYHGCDFPQNPYEQLKEAVVAVFKSWNTARAILYRKVEMIPDHWGTAVNVQAMVFGNRGENSATGVAFTRSPASGENALFGEYLENAQGEDVVAGVRTPLPIRALVENAEGNSLEELYPENYQELKDICKRLEDHYGDMQDVEFTIEEGRLYMLQTRCGKRTGVAQVRIAVDQVNEGLIDKKAALLRVQPSAIEQLLSPVFSPLEKREMASFCVGKGLNAGPGAASGVVALSSAKALEYRDNGTACVLVRTETSPEDFGGMMAAEGILTVRGGATSHAAVVARQFGRPCVCALSGLKIDVAGQVIKVGDRELKEGEPISIDGSSGEVYFCSLKTSPSEIAQVLVEGSIKAEESLIYKSFEQLMSWADEHKRLGVRANADTANDVSLALAFGAVGVGLTRVEHMFNREERLLPLRQIILANGKKCDRPLAEIECFLRSDFREIFLALAGKPMTVRLLDPPMHEFMPHGAKDVERLADALEVDFDELRQSLRAMREVNPMLGFRGCRLGISNPKMTVAQARAIFHAALDVVEAGVACHPEIMIPIVMSENEFEHQKMVIDNTAKEVFAQRGECLLYTVGTMIELPRAALRAEKIAAHASFFSFGTNDLTQTTFGISRDDAGSFLPIYAGGVPHPYVDATGHMEIYNDDPFKVLDQEGVGELIRIGVERGRKGNPALKIGICGEHGGEPSSIDFFHRAGLDYVSCSPYRVPVARLAAAQANLQS